MWTWSTATQKSMLDQVLAWDCRQELPSGVSVTGTRMTAGLKYHQFMSCEPRLEDQKLGKWKFLNSLTHLTLVPTWTKKKPSRWRLTVEAFYLPQLLPPRHMFVYKSSKDSDTMFCFSRASRPLTLYLKILVTIPPLLSHWISLVNLFRHLCTKGFIM